VRELAGRVRRDYAGRELTVVGVMKGAIFFLVDMLRRVDLPVRLEVIHAASYRGAQSTGEVACGGLAESAVRGRHVLVVDDILDTGLTLRKVLDEIAARGPASLRTCVLLSKPSRRRVRIEPDYLGFEIGGEFVVGYGLDFNDQYRHLPYIAILLFEEAAGTA